MCFVLDNYLKVKLAKKTTTKVREKKVYSLPGQKHDPPEEVMIL
jgi:hypothetical protein